MTFPGLGAGTGQLPAVTVNIGPFQTGHLAAPLPGDEQELERMSERIADPVQCGPEDSNFILSQRALALVLLGAL